MFHLSIADHARAPPARSHLTAADVDFGMSQHRADDDGVTF
jgi:hypothetical protein